MVSFFSRYIQLKSFFSDKNITGEIETHFSREAIENKRSKVSTWKIPSFDGSWSSAKLLIDGNLAVNLMNKENTGNTTSGFT